MVGCTYVLRIRFTAQGPKLKSKKMSLNNWNSFLLCVLLASCVNHPIDSSKYPSDTTQDVSSLSKTYREITLLIKDESLYVSSRERWNRFVQCMYSAWNNNRYISGDSESMTVVNGLLNMCLPEDTKVRYLSPNWFESHNACFGDFDEKITDPIQTKKKIQIPYRIIKHINSGYMV